jgi:hypothetical protein
MEDTFIIVTTVKFSFLTSNKVFLTMTVTGLK